MKTSTDATLGILLAVAVVVICRASHGQEDTEESGDVRQGCLAAYELHEENESRFGRCTVSELGDLMPTANDSVALRAAWERVLRTLPRTRQKDAVRPDLLELARFLGFLEGRLKLSAPEWWHTALNEVRAWDADLMCGPFREDLFPYHATEAGLFPAKKEDPLLMAPNGVEIGRSGDSLRLTLGRNAVDITESWREADENDNIVGISAALDDERWFLTLHGHSTNAYRLTCLNRRNGAMLWKAVVLGAPPNSGTSGHAFHRVQVKVDGDRLLLFGYGTFGVYAEGFEAATGRNLFRFSTSY